MIKRQDGMTAVSMVMVVGALVFVASLLLKVVPVYVDDSSIKNVVASFHGKNDMRGQSKKQVLATFDKRLRINNVSVNKEAIKLTRSGSDYVLTVEYEPRGELIGSLEYIVSFKHEAVFPAN